MRYPFLFAAFLAFVPFASAPAPLSVETVHAQTADGIDGGRPASGFSAWLADYEAGARSRGLKQAWLDATLADAQYVSRAVELDRNQPDSPTPAKRSVFASYLARQLTPQKIADGKARVGTWGPAARRIAADSGVPPEILFAIWGMETSYGRIMGSFDLPSAIATLAYDGRREALFTRELDALVRMVGEGRVARADMTGSWAGAFGQSQFLPSSYLAYARDGDGDGKADIRNSTADAFASIANYLKQNGWQAGVPWGFSVGVPYGFDRATVANPVKPDSCVRPMEVHSRWLKVSEWKALGFRPLNAFWPAGDIDMTLVEPDGPGNGAYLTSRSYRAIMAYNCSNFYALSVALLGDALAGDLSAR